MLNHKSVAYFILRITLGMIFLFYGVGKFMMSPGVFAAGLASQFSKSPLLPGALARAFGYTLPFAEFILGLLIFFGIFTRVALALAGLLLVALTFGMVLMGQTQVVANNLIFSLVTFLLLFFAEHNAFAVEGLWRKR